MADAGEGRKKGRPGNRKEEPGKRKGAPGKKARKANTRKRKKATKGRMRANMIFAIAHHVRRAIMRLYVEAEQPLTPAQAAKALHLPVAMITYHVNILRRLGALEVVGRRRRRGATEHLYDHTIEDDPPIETLLDETKDVDDEDIEEGKEK
jgi:hypothetical protein